MVPTRLRVFSSSVGTKILIGATGLGLFLYLVVHIAGNLMVFFGPAAFNKYAYTLEGNPLIPIVELGLLLIFLLHVYKTIAMYIGNQQARPIGYVRKKYAGPPSRKSLASSTMIVSGLWLLIFIVIHVKAFRYGIEYPWDCHPGIVLSCNVESGGSVVRIRTLPVAPPVGTSDGKSYDSAALRGRFVVLAWFPKAFTGG